MKRRTFLTNTGLAGATLALGGTTELIPVGTNASLFSGRVTAATPGSFPQSVASGDPKPNGIVLWTRLAPEAIGGGAVSATLGWQIATAPTFPNGTVILQGLQQVSEAGDFTAKVVVANEALQPWTVYYYRFGFNGVLSKTGRFKTLPAPDTPLQVLRLGYVSCQDYGSGHYTAMAALANEPIDYVIHLGDYIYETIADPSFQSNAVRAVPMLLGGGLIAATLDDYRHLYRLYRSDADLQRVHERFAFINIWDDHEFANDAHQDFHPDNNPSPSQPMPQLRKAASQAWSEYTPADVRFDPLRGALDSIRIYRSFQFGTLVDLVLTDERLYRDGPPCGNEQYQRNLTTGCPERNKMLRTMLGYTQRDWFINRMQGSSARWKIWGNEVMSMALKVANGPIDRYLTLDAWDGYPVERAYLMLSLANVKNLVAITGDIHSYAAGYLKMGYDSIFSPRVGVEFVGGSITSSNFADILSSIGGNSPSAPLPKQTLLSAFPGDLIGGLVRLSNPHIQFFNSDAHGYNLLEITPDALTCTMRKVSTITEPTATVSTLASFTVPNNQIAIHQN